MCGAELSRLVSLAIERVQPHGTSHPSLLSYSTTHQPTHALTNCQPATNQPPTARQVGSKLLAYEVRIASRHAWKAASGKALSRRERAQLTRTTADLFRLVPMVIIVVSVRAKP